MTNFQMSAKTRGKPRMVKTITGNPFTLPRMSTPANDNVPRRNVVTRPNDGPSPEWLAERNAAGTATEYGSDGNRIERALVKEGSPLVPVLRQVAELMRPAVVAANDNQPPTDEGGEVNSGFGAERIHDQGSITPSVPMLIRSVADGMRPRFIRHPDGTSTSVATGHQLLGGWHLAGWSDGKKKLTGVIVFDGEIIAYGNDHGRKCRPAYKADPLGLVFDKKSEAAKHVERQPTENGSYLRLAGRGRYISSQRPDAPGSIAPTPRTARAAANDNDLAAAIANTPVMPPVKMLPDGVAKEYGRLAGIADINGVGEGATSAPMHEALSELERAEQLHAAGFDDGDLAIIDAILDDASFRTIGLANGHAKSSAHRMGRKAVEKVLKRISEKIAA